MRESVKNVLTATLAAAMLLTNTSCTTTNADNTTKEFKDAWSHSVQFVNIADTSKWYRNTDYLKKYDETVTKLKPVIDRFYSETGHQIYLNENGEECIISGASVIKLSDIKTYDIFLERDGYFVHMVKDDETKQELIKFMKDTDTILNGDFINISDDKYNAVINYRKYRIDDLVRNIKDGYYALNMSALKKEGIIDFKVDETLELIEIFNTPMMDRDLSIEHPYSKIGFEQYIDENKNYYYMPYYQQNLNSYWVPFSVLESKLGWKIEYVEDGDMLALLMDDIYSYSPEKGNVKSTDEVDYGRFADDVTYINKNGDGFKTIDGETPDYVNDKVTGSGVGGNVKPDYDKDGIKPGEKPGSSGGSTSKPGSEDDLNSKPEDGSTSSKPGDGSASSKPSTGDSSGSGSISKPGTDTGDKDTSSKPSTDKPPYGGGGSSGSGTTSKPSTPQYDPSSPNYGKLDSLEPTYPKPNDGKQYAWGPGQGWVLFEQGKKKDYEWENMPNGGGGRDPHLV